MRRTSARIRPAVAVAIAAVVAISGCPASDPDSGFRPGAAGSGDPYFPEYGNGGYDVASYELDLRYDPVGELTGRATIVATAKQGLSRFNLDLVALAVDSVEVDGKPATIEQSETELIIKPERGLPEGAQFRVEVAYGGEPTTVSHPALGVGGFLSGQPDAVAVGQPISASTWFPVNDHPADKATYEIRISVPEGLSAVSNGVLTDERTADGWTSRTWSERSPMASYLATIVVGNFRVRKGTHRGKPLVTAFDMNVPEGGPAATSLARTGEIADFLATRFGPYPFDSYGGIVIDDPRIRYALETQSRPVYSHTFFRSGENLSVVAHELAHQWFGNSVSLSRWSDMWLNEGFATYAEWLWEEHDGGRTAQQSFEQQYGITDWSKPTLDPGPDALFSPAVYKRGALAVHALRRTVGDDVFFTILRTWTAERRGANATTDDLVALAERVSGKPLRPLFDAWLTGSTAPALP